MCVFVCVQTVLSNEMKSREVDEAVEVLLQVLNLLKFWFSMITVMVENTLIRQILKPLTGEVI